jgi:uncharacterized protein with von Willebrand factor type A (vWA) domain
MAAAATLLSPEGLAPSMRLRLAGFLRTLRAAGFTPGLAEAADAARLLASPMAARPFALQGALRALLVTRRDERERFDEIFSAFWLGRGQRTVRRSLGSPASSSVPPQRKPGRTLADLGAQGLPDGTRRGPQDGAEAQADGRGRRGGASSREALAGRDVRHLADPQEIAEAHALAERLARRMRARLTRRMRARASGLRLDIRRTIHRSIGSGGEPVDLVWRRRKPRPLRLVILLDASGSMEMYTGFFVRFVHGVAESFRESEAFLFHTRLVHVSDALRDRDPARALDRLGLMAQGVGGGTRIGESLAAFNRWHAKRVLNARSCVLVFSDGYDTGDPALLGAEMRRLGRRCRRIVWLNPLIGWEGYEPSARGMQAALPFVDLFAPAHNLESLAALEPYLARL